MFSERAIPFDNISNILSQQIASEIYIRLNTNKTKNIVEDILTPRFPFQKAFLIYERLMSGDY